jgi:hypothetical protein
MFNFDEASKKGKEVMDGMLKSYAEMSKGMQAIAAEAADYSRKSYQDGVAHAEALTSVRSPEAVFELQAAYLRASYEAAVSQATRMGELYADLGKLAYKPFEAPVATKEKASAKSASAAVKTVDATATAANAA